MKKYFILGFCSVVVALFLLVYPGISGIDQPLEELQKPNILFIFTDDQSYSSVNILGNEDVSTPNMDKLVKGGISFSNAYIMGGSSPAICSPSRAMLFSGLTLWNLENQGMYGFEISKKYRTLPQVFRENGYITFATGKNEPGRKGHFARSFSQGDKILFRGMTGSQYELPLCPFSPEGDYSPDKEEIHTGVHSAELYANAAIRFLENQRESEQPFFAYVAFQTPHDPRQAPEEFLDRYEPEEMELPASFLPEHPFDNGMLRIRDENLAGFPRQAQEIKRHIADYYAMVSHDDRQIGRILDALEKSGKYENTIIVFASDNGLAVGKHGLMGKQNVYEHSIRVPFVISGPGISKGETRDQLCYIYDVYPTLCDLAGIRVPDEVQFKSLIPSIKDKGKMHRAYLYFAFMSWQRSLRKNDYKLIEYAVEGKRFTQLFDLSKDREELNNLAANPEYTKVLENLRTMLKSESLRQNDGNSTSAFASNQGMEFWKIYENTEKSEFPTTDLTQNPGY
ncbi:sulfatase-like hydrolase/transferase [Pleomorphovibrio marinus]|uniref:sulfatase-like hydrolase/transferase n=1 Tax=Pleomorphovibrio marinus TaxID=2164132 RepID=UPI0018E59F64|nr:sulfatase-like hydrolase/transferase [Pleomorphovibrio marinus]